MSRSLALVVNSGSSSVKCALYEVGSGLCLARILADSLNSAKSHIKFSFESASGATLQHRIEQPDLKHEQALNLIFDELDSHFQVKQDLCGIGHRVVHGGELFTESTLIDDKVINQIRDCSHLAPLHNPPNLLAIELLRHVLPDLPQVAVFDTAFHQSLPPHAYTYALPYELYQQQGVRRYGFHGTSHRYIGLQTAALLGKMPQQTSLISAHLGNGCSICAIKHGKSVDTSMGMTPLEGLVMGSRSGDVDPGIFEFLNTQGMQPDQINRMLNRESGLLGLSGISNDMRTLTQLANEGNERAALAVKVFCFRLAKYIASMSVSLTEIDALVFTGGIGENSAMVRELTLSHLALFRSHIDTQQNQANGSQSEGQIGTLALTDNSNPIPVLVIKTDEEGMILRDTLQTIRTNPAS